MHYAPGGWPDGTSCVVRRVRVRAGDVSTDPRARRRRTIPKDQLALALDGLVDEVWAYSFIATNLDVSTPAKAAALEAWHRMRTDIEDRIRDAKHGAALRHLPSGDRTVNTVWMWAALLAINMSAWLHELTGLDDGHGRGRPPGHPAPPTAGRARPADTPRRTGHPAATPRTPPARPGPDPTATTARLDLTTGPSQALPTTTETREPGAPHRETATPTTPNSTHNIDL